MLVDQTIQKVGTTSNSVVLTKNNRIDESEPEACEYNAILLRLADGETTELESVVVPGRPTWQQTMLRIADPEKSIPFYTDILGMTVIDTLDFPQYEFKLFFLTTLPEGETYDLTPGTQEAHVRVF